MQVWRHATTPIFIDWHLSIPTVFGSARNSPNAFQPRGCTKKYYHLKKKNSDGCRDLLRDRCKRSTFAAKVPSTPAFRRSKLEHRVLLKFLVHHICFGNSDINTCGHNDVSLCFFVNLHTPSKESPLHIMEDAWWQWIGLWEVGGYVWGMEFSKAAMALRAFVLGDRTGDRVGSAVRLGDISEAEIVEVMHDPWRKILSLNKFAKYFLWINT